MPTTDYLRTGYAQKLAYILGENDDYAIVLGNDTTLKFVRQPFGGASQSEVIAISGTTVSYSGVQKLPDGTAAAPSQTFSTDTGSDLGLYFAAQNVMGVTSGGVNCFGFDASGGILPSVDRLAWSSTANITGTLDLFLFRDAAATLRMGAAASGTPVDQTIKIQDASGTDIAGSKLTLGSGKGTGLGAGGDFVLQVAYPGLTGTTLNALGSVVTIKGANKQSLGTTAMFDLTPTINQSGTAAYVGLRLNVTETATGSGAKRLLDAQVGGVSKMYIANTGAAHVAAEKYYDFGSEATASATATLTAAQVLGGFINSAPAAGITLTFPTAALMVAGVTGAQVGDIFYLFIENTAAGANTITLAAGASQTLRGGTAIAQNKSAVIANILTNVGSGTETYTSYSIVGA